VSPFSAHDRPGFTCEIKSVLADAFEKEIRRAEDES
jgi:hypothetical protein